MRVSPPCWRRSPQHHVAGVIPAPLVRSSFPNNRCFLSNPDNRSVSSPASSLLQPTVSLSRNFCLEDWKDRNNLQDRWNLAEKGWAVSVTWRSSNVLSNMVGLFANQDISAGEILRVGKNGVNLIEFRSLQDIEDFLCNQSYGSDNDDRSLHDARLDCVSKFMWGFYPDNTDELGYYNQLERETVESKLFIGMWIPGNELNHSLQPNTVYRPADGGTDDGINLVSLRDISKGEELFDDYRRHGRAPKWVRDFSKKYGDITLNFADCNDFV